jgi:hypothetical protein
MSKSRNVNAVEIVGAVGLIVSLIYVAYELSQNTVAIRAQAHQQLVEITLSIQEPEVMDSRIAELVFKANTNWESLTGVEKHQYRIMLARYMNIWELAFYNHQDGVLSDEVWESWDSGMRHASESPAWRGYWQHWQETDGSGFGKSFIDHVNQ